MFGCGLSAFVLAHHAPALSSQVLALDVADPPGLGPQLELLTVTRISREDLLYVLKGGASRLRVGASRHRQPGPPRAAGRPNVLHTQLARFALLRSRSANAYERLQRPAVLGTTVGDTGSGDTLSR
jgi:hypothetical protein